MLAKIRSHSFGSLMALLGILAMIGLGSSVLTGCTSGSDSAPPVDEKAVKAEYQADAEKTIDEKNADQVLDDLEKELNADVEE